MDIQTYQNISTQLLKKHYGLELNDTELSDESLVQSLIDDDVRPYAYINEMAQDFFIDRVDICWNFGKPLTQLDEQACVK